MTPPLLPYAQPWVDARDHAAVLEALASAWLTTGPRVEAFEAAVAEFVGAREAVAVSSGTAALHAALQALGVGPGDEVIVPPLTFAATANAVVYQGGTPVFADIDPDTLLLDPAAVASRLSPRTKGLIAVDYAGQPCDYQTLGELARRHGLFLVADACHALGAADQGRKVGTLADLTVFSFHPVKHITTGEGGMVVTDAPELAARVRRFRNHGLTSDHRERQAQGTWDYDLVELGYNYRLSDIQCALGLSQLARLPEWLDRRQAIARRYDQAFAGVAGLMLPRVRPGVSHAYHLYVILLNLEFLHQDRGEIFRQLRAAGLGVNVHYKPVYWHSFYQQRFALPRGLCPRAEAAYERLLTLPLFPAMTATEVERVAATVTEVLEQATMRGPRRLCFP